MENNFMLNVIAALNKQLSKKRLGSDLKSLDNTMYVKVLAKLSTALAKKELKKQLKELNNLYVQIGTDIKVDKNVKENLQKHIKNLQDAISELEIGFKVSKSDINSDIELVRKHVLKKVHNSPISFNLQIKKDKLLYDIEYLAKRYSKLFSNASATTKYENLMNNAYNVSDNRGLADTRAELAALTSELKANGLAVKSTSDKWRALIERSKELFSAAAVIRVVFSQVRQSVSTFLELDSAMTGLYKVQNDIASRDQFSGLLTRWNNLAQKLSVTTRSLIDGATEWSKIGFNLDMSEELAQITAIFEKTAEISNQQASATLISSAQAFTEIDEFGEEDYIERVEAIGNKINAVGNKYSISSEGIAEALQNSSASLRMANNDLDESIAMITTANKIFQSPSEVGNMLKVVSARLRGQRGELEALNEDTENMIEGVSKVQTQILNLTHNRVNIFENDNETLKSTYQIMKEVGAELDNLSDKDSASLLEIIFGKQRMSSGASLLLNYKELEKIKNDSMNAANSMSEEYAKYLESAEAHITTLKEKLVETYSVFMSGDTIKFVADTGSAILDLVNHTDLLRHSLLGVASIKIGTGISTIGASIASTAKQMNILGNALQRVRNLPLDSVLRKEMLKQVGTETSSLTEKNLKLLLSQKQLDDIDRIRILTQHNLTDEEIHAKLAKIGLTTATNAQSVANTTETATTFTLKNALTSLKASVIGVGNSMKAAFLSNPIGLGLAAITTVVSVATSAISKQNEALEENRRKNMEAAETASENADRLKELYMEYTRLASVQNRTTSEEESFQTAVENIIKALGTKAEVLADLTAGTEEYAQALAKVTKEEWQSNAVQATIGRKAAEEELQGDIWSTWTGSKVNVSSNNTAKRMSEEAKEAVELVSDTLKQFETIDYYGTINWNISSKDPVETLEFYNALVEARENLVLASKDNEALLNTDVYNNMNAAINTISESLDVYIEKLYEEEKLLYLAQNNIPQTAEEYQSMKSAMEGVAGGSIDLQKKFTDLLMNDFPALATEMTEVKEASEALTSNKTSVFSISDDDIKTLQDYQKSIESVTSALSNLSSMNTSDIISIMTEFPQYAGIFEQFGVTGVQGVGDLEGALKELASTLMTTASTACPQMADAIQKIYSEMLTGGTSADILTNELLYLEEVIQKVKSGQALSSSELSVLISRYGDLSEAVSIINGGYTIELDKLESLKDSKEKEARSAIAWQIKQTEEAIADAKKRIEAYKIEKQALDDLTKSYTQNRFQTIDDYISEYGEKAAEETFGDLTEYYENQMASTKLYASTKKLEDLQKQLSQIGAISSSSSKSTSSTKSETIFDWIETRVKRAEEVLDRLNSKLESVSDYTSQNAYIAEMLSAYDKELQTLDEAKKKYLELADAVGLSASYIEKIKNGTLNIETVTDEVIKKKINSYQEWYEKSLDMEQSIDDTKKKIKELNRQKLDNIINDFERVTSLANAYKDYYQTLLDVQEAKGNDVSESDYNNMIQKELDLQATLREQYDKTQTEFDKLDLSPADDEWYDYQEELVGIQAEIEDLTISVEKFRDAILEIRWDTFEKGMDSLSNLSDEISDVMSMFDDADMFKDGEITDIGITKLGLYAQQYVTAKKKIAEYNNAIAKLGEMYKNGSISLTEYNEKLAEFQSAQRDAMLSVKDSKDAIMDFNEEAIQAEIDNMEELIQKKKEALDAEKNLHDYQQSIAKKQKSITALQKKIDTLSLSDAREDIALKLKLEEQLAQEKEELADMEYEHSVEQQKNAMDEELEEFKNKKQEELDELRNNLDKQNDLIEDYLDKVEDNYDIVYDNISKISDEFGITFTDSLTSPWESATGAAQLYADAVGKIMAQLQIDSSKLQDFTGTSMGSEWSEEQAGEWIQQDGKWWYKHTDGSYTKDGDKSNGWEKIDGKWYHFDSEGWMDADKWIDDRDVDGNYYYVGSDGAMLTDTTTPDGYEVDSHGAWIKDGKDNNSSSNNTIESSVKVSDISGNIKFGDTGSDVEKLQTALEELGYSVGEHGIDGKFGSDTMKAVKSFQFNHGIGVDGIVGSETKYKFKLNGYKNGLLSSPNNQIAMTDENGEEIILRAGITGNLTQLTKGSSVIPADLSEKLMKVAYNPAEFISKYTPKVDFVVNRRSDTPVEVNVNTPLIEVHGGLETKMLGEMQRMVDDIPKTIAREFKSKGLR